jgi:predicted nucleic acid-binding protein
LYLRQAGQDDPKFLSLAPAQLVYEVGNSIMKNKELTEEDAANAIEDLVDMEIELISLSHELSGNAIRIACDSSITFYDATYIALSDHFSATLISADSAMLSSKSKKAKENSLHLKDFHV